MDGEDTVNKAADQPTVVTAASVLLNEYFFPGGGIWKPMSIKAPNREQAEEIHRAKREPIEKVGEQTINE